MADVAKTPCYGGVLRVLLDEIDDGYRHGQLATRCESVEQNVNCLEGHTVLESLWVLRNQPVSSFDADKLPRREKFLNQWHRFVTDISAPCALHKKRRTLETHVIRESIGEGCHAV